MESTRSPYRKHLYVCLNRREDGRVCCAGREAEAILEKLKTYVAENGLKGRVRVNRSGCLDLCEQGPNVMVYPDNRWYSHVSLGNVEQIIQEHLEPLVPREVDSRFRGNDGKVRAFLFDLGNVLVRFDHMEAARKITDGSGVSPEQLFRIFFESPLVVDHDTGKISCRQFHEALRREMGLSVPYVRFLEVWNSIFTEDRAMTGLVRRLLTRYPVYLISNTNRAHFEHLREIYTVIDDLNGWILSYEVGHLKPHPAIYQRALELARVPAREIFYVDDREDLIDTGRKMGFWTHHFTQAELLQNALTTICAL